MLRSVQGRAACFVAVAGFLVAGIVVDASAKSRSKPKTPTFSHATPAAVTGARFFTINQVLAKLDSGSTASANDGVKLAAVGQMTKGDGGIAAAAAVARDEPFGLVSFRAPQGALWVKWRAVSASAAEEAAATAWCREGGACASPARRYLSMLERARELSVPLRISAVNRMVNEAIRYVGDYGQHGIADRWSSPLATLASGRGDCEDYALLKYGLLIESGIDASDVRLLLVRDREVRQDHAVLAVKAQGRWLVLDNRTSRPLDIADVGHFMPLFAIDSDGVKLLAAPFAARPLHESEIDVAPATAVVP